MLTEALWKINFVYQAKLEKTEWVFKPGSVPSELGGDHLTWLAVAS